MEMSPFPCASFTPISIEGIQFCLNCGYLGDFHQTEPVGVIQVDQHCTQESQQFNGLAELPLYLKNPQVEQWAAQQPSPLCNGNKSKYSCNSLTKQLLLDELVRHRAFNSLQVRRMIDKAEALQWTLKGLSQDDDIDKFCKEIGVERKQFSKWVYRTRRRIAKLCT